jgi:hypothetical protein
MMAADAVGPDPKTLWREQEQETDAMTLEQIHALVRRYDSKATRQGIALAVCLVAIGAVGTTAWIRDHDPVTAILFFGGELTTIYQVWRMAFPPRDPSEPAGAYLRRRLQLKLAHLQGRWLLVMLPLAPYVLWLGYLMYQRHQTPPMVRLAPFIIIAVGLLFVAARVRRRAPQIKAQIDELDGLLGR